MVAATTATSRMPPSISTRRTVRRVSRRRRTGSMTGAAVRSNWGVRSSITAARSLYGFLDHAAVRREIGFHAQEPIGHGLEHRRIDPLGDEVIELGAVFLDLP